MEIRLHVELKVIMHLSSPTNDLEKFVVAAQAAHVQLISRPTDRGAESTAHLPPD